MTADPVLINPDNLAQPFRGMFFHGGPLGLYCHLTITVLKTGGGMYS